jgi:acetolactate synthase I/III small subunit
MNKHLILAFMLDRPGVLNKISGLMRRKMYNIDTLTVCETEKKGISRMTIALKCEEGEGVQHIIKQLLRINEIVSAEDLDAHASFWREVALIRCKLDEAKLHYLKENFKFEILQAKGSQYIVQIAGSIQRIDAFISEMTMKNIIELARSGPTSMHEINNV